MKFTVQWIIVYVSNLRYNVSFVYVLNSQYYVSLCTYQIHNTLRQSVHVKFTVQCVTVFFQVRINVFLFTDGNSTILFFSSSLILTCFLSIRNHVVAEVTICNARHIEAAGIIIRFFLHS